MERVVYLLGAGFSAPLGIPVMNDFVMRSRDLYFGDPEKYRHFDSVLKTVNELHVAKSFFSSPLHNIEEILSILEMRGVLIEMGGLMSESYRRYIADTVTGFSPRFETVRHSNTGWTDTEFRGEKGLLLRFLALAFGLEIRNEPRGEDSGNLALRLKRREEVEIGEVRYDFITLNYDLVLEDALRATTNVGHGYPEYRFHTVTAAVGDLPGDYCPWLVKLHGSADVPQSIVPPTWRKALHPNIERQWQKAHELLSQAHHIRVVGYSLPDSDAYVRYLLKSALAMNTNPKSFDVLCLDPTGVVQKRYDEFVTFYRYRFRNCDVLNYLREAQGLTSNLPEHQGRLSVFFRLNHEWYMRRHD